MNDNTSSSKTYILLAEDEEAYARVLIHKLTKERFEVVHVSDGASALQMARERRPMLVLLDIVMPIKNGFETLKEFKEDAQLKDIPVIVISSLGQETDVERAKTLGAADYLVKAYTPIRDTIEKILPYVSK